MIVKWEFDLKDEAQLDLFNEILALAKKAGFRAKEDVLVAAKRSELADKSTG